MDGGDDTHLHYQPRPTATGLRRRLMIGWQQSMISSLLLLGTIAIRRQMSIMRQRLSFKVWYSHVHGWVLIVSFMVLLFSKVHAVFSVVPMGGNTAKIY